MHIPLLSQLTQATAQLRAGKLLDATALIQRAMQRAAPGPQPQAEFVTIDGVAEPAGTQEPRAATAQPRQARQATPPGQGGSFTRHIFQGEAGSRPYKLFVPAGVAGEELPLIVMLHGCTQSADSFAAATNMNTLAQEQHCLVAYPEQTAHANTSRCWNWFRTNDQIRGQGEPALIAGIVKEIASRHHVNPKRIAAAGLSAGGALAAILGETYPDLFAAIGVHSGLACGAARDMPSAMMAMKTGGAAKPRANAKTPVPTIVFHGSGDATVNPANGQAVIAQVSAGTPGRVTTRHGRSAGGRNFTVAQAMDDDGRVLTEHWIVEGMGHAWSGGAAGQPYTDPRGPDASREMLRFFGEHAGI